MSSVRVNAVHTALLSGPAPSQACPSGQAPPPLQVRTELSDGRRQVLRRSDKDLAWMMKTLVDCFPDDRDMLSNQLLSGLLRVRAAEKSPDPEFKIQEINKLLTTIIHLPLKFSQSEPVQTFFGLDQDSRADPDRTKPGLTEDPDQTKEPSETSEEPRVQSPGPDQVLVRLVSCSEVLRCNGFCLANTETVFFDQWERRGQSVGQWEQSGRRAVQSECGADRRASTSCLGHAPHCGLSHLIGRVVRGRSLKRKKAASS